MKWLFFVIIFLIAIFLGVEIVKEPGYALFVYKDWTVQMPLWFCLLGLLIVLFSVYFFTRIFCSVVFLKRSIKFWWRERCFHQKEIKSKKK